MYSGSGPDLLCRRSALSDCYHPRSGVCNSFGRVCLMSVCLSVCLTITFESLDVKFIFAHAVYLHGLRVEFVYEGHLVKGQGHRSQKGRKFLFPPCKTSIGYNFRSIKHTAVMFACSMGFRVLQIEWCHRHLCHVTGSDHAQLNARIRGWSALD